MKGFGSKWGSRAAPSVSRQIQKEQGAALVEMALVLPLLLLLMIGIFSTARAWQVHNVLDHAAREAARHGATLDGFTTSSDYDSAKAIARGVGEAELQAAAVPLEPLTWCIDMKPDPCEGTEIPDTEQVGVRITYPNYKLSFVFFSLTVDLQATAYSRYES